MPKIRFNQAHKVKGAEVMRHGEDNSAESFEEGEVVERNEASCEHFVRRGLAERVDDKTPVGVPKGEPKDKKKDSEPGDGQKDADEGKGSNKGKGPTKNDKGSDK